MQYKCNNVFKIFLFYIVLTKMKLFIQYYLKLHYNNSSKNYIVYDLGSHFTNIKLDSLGRSILAIKRIDQRAKCTFDALDFTSRGSSRTNLSKRQSSKPIAQIRLQPRSEVTIVSLLVRKPRPGVAPEAFRESGGLTRTAHQRGSLLNELSNCRSGKQRGRARTAIAQIDSSVANKNSITLRLLSKSSGGPFSGEVPPPSPLALDCRFLFFFLFLFVRRRSLEKMLDDVIAAPRIGC